MSHVACVSMNSFKWNCWWYQARYCSSNHYDQQPPATHGHFVPIEIDLCY